MDPYFDMYLRVYFSIVAAMSLFLVCATVTSTLTRDQIDAEGRVGYYSATEHGGVWGNFVLATIVAHLVAHYTWPIMTSPDGTAWLGFSIGLAVGVFGYYAKIGIKDPSIIDGRVTLAGCVLAAIMAGFIWALGPVYLGWVKVPHELLIVLAQALSAYFVLAVVKFNPAWRWRMNDTIQVGLLIAGLALRTYQLW